MLKVKNIGLLLNIFCVHFLRKIAKKKKKIDIYYVQVR